MATETTNELGFAVRLTVYGTKTEVRIQRPVTDAKVKAELERLGIKGGRLRLRVQETSDYGGAIFDGKERVGDYFIVPGSERKAKAEAR
jgi:hypothetical protein